MDEKPYLLNRAVVAVINVGEFTERYYRRAGDDITAWAAGVPVTALNAHIVCVPEAGLAAVYQVTEDFDSAEQPADLFIGAHANRLYFRDECDAGRVTLATDDGAPVSMGASATRWTGWLNRA